MTRFISGGLVFIVFLSCLTLVNGIKGYRTNSLYGDDPYYINFYLEPNQTQSKKGYAEFCNYANNNTCEDVADLAPVYSKKKDPDSEKVTYAFDYPSHTKTGKKLIVLMHYDPKYSDDSQKPGILINNETLLYLEYQWTLDKIPSSNHWYDVVVAAKSRGTEIPMQTSRERDNWTNKIFAFGMILLNLVIAFCVFFGSFYPRCCLLLVFCILGFGLLALVPEAYHLEIIIPFLVILAVNFKPNPRKRFILTFLALVFWEFWFYKEYKQPGPCILSLALYVVFFGAAYYFTKESKNKFLIISTAYIGSFFPFIIYYAILMRSLHSAFPYLLASRHILGLVGVVSQVKMLREIDQLAMTSEAKATEKTPILGTDSAHTLTNSFL